MTIQETIEIYRQLQKSKHGYFFRELIKLAENYTQIRVKWWKMDREGRSAIDSSRTLIHNAFIDACNSLSRNMKKTGEDTSWREKVGYDRKAIGDFACYLYCAMGIMAR